MHNEPPTMGFALLLETALLPGSLANFAQASSSNPANRLRVLELAKHDTVLVVISATGRLTKYV